MHRNIILHGVLYGCEIWFLALREVYRLRMFKNRTLSKMFEPKREEVMGVWRECGPSSSNISFQSSFWNFVVKHPYHLPSHCNHLTHKYVFIVCTVLHYIVFSRYHWFVLVLIFCERFFSQRNLSFVRNSEKVSMFHSHTKWWIGWVCCRPPWLAKLLFPSAWETN